VPNKGAVYAVAEQMVGADIEMTNKAAFYSLA
jgi:hypothetical protein